MTAKEWFTQKSQELENDSEFLTYKANLDFTEDMLRILNEKGIRYINKYLSEKLNCSPAYVTKLLKGNPNLTIKKMVEIALILDQNIQIKLIPKASMISNKLPVKNEAITVETQIDKPSFKKKYLKRKPKVQL